MKRNRVLLSGAIFAAAWMVGGVGSASAQSSKSAAESQTIHPDPTGAKGASQSERTGGESEAPLPKGSPYSGTVEKGTTESRQSPGSSASETIHPDPNKSKGGSRSERAGDTPLPEGSPYSGTVEKEQSGTSKPQAR